MRKYIILLKNQELRNSALYNLSTAPNLRYSTNTNKNSFEEEEMNKLLNESIKDNYKTFISNNNIIREISFLLGSESPDEMISKLKYQIETIKLFKIKDEVHFI